MIQIALMIVCKIVQEHGVAQQLMQISMQMQMVMVLVQDQHLLSVMRQFQVDLYQTMMMQMMLVSLMFMTVLVSVMVQHGKVIVVV